MIQTMMIVRAGGLVRRGQITGREAERVRGRKARFAWVLRFVAARA